MNNFRKSRGLGFISDSFKESRTNKKWTRDKKKDYIEG